MDMVKSFRSRTWATFSPGVPDQGKGDVRSMLKCYGDRRPMSCSWCDTLTNLCGLH